MPSAFGVSPSFWQNGVLDRNVTDPSTLTPANGDRFIVGPSAIGVWLGQDNNIAEYNATFDIWGFSSPTEGWTTYVVDEDIYVRYTGIIWVILGSAALDISVEEASINIASSVDTINFTGGLSVTDNGSGKVTIDVTGDAIAVEDDGVGVISNLVTLNLGSNLIVTDNGSGKVTVDASGNQNLWETIIADTGSVVANIITDTLTVSGGTGISTSITGDVLTITNADPNVDQNLFETINADIGSTTANTITDALTILGGPGLKTTIVGDTLTADLDFVTPLTVTGASGDFVLISDVSDSGNVKKVNLSDLSGGVSQNLWETITADSGSTIANITTDTLNILGATSEIITSIVSDTVFISLADNIILPGTESLTVPIGTTVQRPGIPVAGMMRYNSTLGCIEIYDGAWSCLRKQDEVVGAVFVLPFSTDGNFQNSWLDFTGNNILTNATPSVMAFKSKLIALTFSNDSINPTLDFEIYRTPETVEPTVTQDLMFTWSIVTVRTGRKTNFATDVIFEAGDKIGIYGRKIGSAGSNVIITLFMQVVESNDEEVFDSTIEDMSI